LGSQHDLATPRLGATDQTYNRWTQYIYRQIPDKELHKLIKTQIDVESILNSSFSQMHIQEESFDHS
ncbi:hypothetical protein, partial [Corallococcus caeni]|uniref:hypothetical protein n=1 Tax=Corallococcus caeni TaxID=3082388 RepID=UPI0030C6C68C